MSLGLLRMASVRPAAHASPVLTLLPARGGRATVGAAPVAWVAVPLVLAGCFPSYRWTSDTGRACFLDCQRGKYLCMAGCGSLGNACAILAYNCRRDEERCMTSCSDVVRAD